MNQVEALCDRVALIDQGRLMVYGEVDEVRRRHSLPEVRSGARGRCPRCPRWPRVARGGRNLAADAREWGSPSDVLTALVRPAPSIDRFEPMLAPMEDIFLRVVREGPHETGGARSGRSRRSSS